MEGPRMLSLAMAGARCFGGRDRGRQDGEIRLSRHINKVSVPSQDRKRLGHRLVLLLRAARSTPSRLGLLDPDDEEDQESCRAMHIKAIGAQTP